MLLDEPYQDMKKVLRSICTAIGRRSTLEKPISVNFLKIESTWAISDVSKCPEQLYHSMVYVAFTNWNFNFWKFNSLNLYFQRIVGLTGRQADLFLFSLIPVLMLIT